MRISFSAWTVLLLLTFAVMASPQILAVILLAALWHEWGHLAMVRLMGGGVEEVRITALGAEMRMAYRPQLSYGREMLAVVAGPGVNIMAAVLLSEAGSDWEMGYLMAGAHLTLGLFNLLPICPLDGGSLLWLLLAWWTDPFWADRVTQIVGWVISCGVLVLGMWLWQKTGNLFLLVGAAGLLWAEIKEKKLVKTKESR